MSNIEMHRYLDYKNTTEGYRFLYKYTFDFVDLNSYGIFAKKLPFPICD